MARQWAERAAIAVCVGVLISACSSDGDTASTSAPSSTEPGGVVDGTDLPTTTQDPSDPGSVADVDAGPAENAPLSELFDTAGGCAPDATDVPEGWPFDVPDAIVVIATSIDRLRYELVGVTSDGEATLNDALDTTFAGFDAEEMDTSSDPDVLMLGLVGEGGVGSIEMVSPDEDGCWAVRLVATLDEAPADADFAASAPPNDPLDALSSLGRGEVITGRGTASLFVTACGLEPVQIEASGTSGRLELRSAGADVVATWVHADGVEVADEQARVLASTADSIAVAFSGQTPDGEESVIVDLQCTDRP